jgi:site-specific DNA-methyltransferase (adenine-specific)
MIDLNRGDCLELMKRVPDGCVDLVLTDPPYGTTICKWDSVIPLEPMWRELKRVIKPNGAIVMTASQPFTSRLIMSNVDMFKYELIWDKKTGLGFLDSKFRPLKSHENIVVFSYGGSSNGSKIPMKYNPQGLIETEKKNKNTKSSILNSEPKNRGLLNTTHTGYPKSIHTFSRDSGLHPTQKPVPLMEYLIRTYSNDGDTVLDFTMGSGTTGVACVNTNRNFIGIEKDDKYFEIAKNRIEALIKEKQCE